MSTTPVTYQSLGASGLKVSKLLKGFRGKPAGDVPALIETVLACTRYAEANVDSLTELDINPVIVRPAGHGAVAVDALIRLAGNTARIGDNRTQARSDARSPTANDDNTKTQLDAASKRSPGRS